MSSTSIPGLGRSHPNSTYPSNATGASGSTSRDDLHHHGHYSSHNTTGQGAYGQHQLRERERDHSFGTTSATDTSSPVTKMFSFTGLGDVPSSKLAFTSEPMSDGDMSYSLGPDVTSTGLPTRSAFTSPIFPGLVEDYEPSSSGRSSSEAPLSHPGSVFPSNPTVVVGGSDERDDTHAPGQYGYQIHRQVYPYPDLSPDSKTTPINGISPSNQSSTHGAVGAKERSLLTGLGEKGSTAPAGDSGTAPIRIMGIHIKWIS